MRPKTVFMEATSQRRNLYLPRSGGGEDEDVELFQYPTDNEAAKSGKLSKETRGDQLPSYFQAQHGVVAEDDSKFTWDLAMVFRRGKKKRFGLLGAKRPTQSAMQGRAGGEEDEEEEEEEEESEAESGDEGVPRSTEVLSALELGAGSQRELYDRTTAETVNRLNLAGLKTALFVSAPKPDKIYCLIGATEARLEEEADRIGYQLELDTHEVINQGLVKKLQLCESVTDKNSKNDRLINMYEWFPLFGRFVRDNPHNPDGRKLYRCVFNDGDRLHSDVFHSGSVFRAIDRIKLTMSIVTSFNERVVFDGEESNCGARLSVEAAEADSRHSLKVTYPLHQRSKIKELTNEWYAASAIFNQPLRLIRDYFGEKVAMYFAFLGFYNRWLLVPAFVGFGFFMNQLTESRIDISTIPLYGFFVAIWSTLFLEFWKRDEAKHRVEWGMSEFVVREQTRPEFKGEFVHSPVDGSSEKYFPFWRKVGRVAVSYSVVSALIMVVIGTVFGIFLLRELLIEWSPTIGSYATAAINAFQIQVLNLVYDVVARKLTDYENHRTESMYENALISKNFVFKFANSYNSLFYIAFVKKHDSRVGGCVENDCLRELQIQLATIFIAQIVLNNVVEIVWPLVRKYRRIRKYRDTNKQDDRNHRAKHPAEIDYALAPYEGTFDDYDELIIQFGFLSLFVVAFPLAPLLALLNNFVEVRLDATKVCELQQRPIPKGAANIGTWYDVLEMVAFISVITNSALIVFQTAIVDEWTDGSAEAKIWLFIIVEHVVFFIKAVVAYFVPDTPRAVLEHQKRQEFLVNVLINGWEPDVDVVEKDEAIEEADVEELQRLNWADVKRAAPETVHLWGRSRSEFKAKGRRRG